MTLQDWVVDRFLQVVERVQRIRQRLKENSIQRKIRQIESLRGERDELLYRLEKTDLRLMALSLELRHLKENFRATSTELTA